MPAKSRANVEQSYFAKEYGFFFRIDTGWITPLNNDLEFDVFGHPYLDMLDVLNYHMVNNNATVNNMNFTLDAFCYKPISGEGCLVESAMQYFLNDPAILDGKGMDNAAIKTLATCITPLPG